jgi:SHS family lactate transporter-like MFS transporter
VADVAFTITATLMMRPVGALLFGWMADRWGRRLPLMIDVIFYSVVELLSGFAPSYTVFLVLRALYGIGMGGEWGVGASLAMEAVPARWRGTLSGLLQEGYSVGYLLAAAAYFFIFPRFGWRAMFIAGGLPALLTLYIRTKVPESPGVGARAPGYARDPAHGARQPSAVHLPGWVDDDDESDGARDPGHVSDVSAARARP